MSTSYFSSTKSVVIFLYNIKSGFPPDLCICKIFYFMNTIKCVARFVSLLMKVAIVFFYEVIRQNKKGNIHLQLVCVMLLIGFQKGIPLHTIPSWLCQLGSVLLT